MRHKKEALVLNLMLMAQQMWMILLEHHAGSGVAPIRPSSPNYILCEQIQRLPHTGVVITNGPPSITDMNWRENLKTQHKGKILLHILAIILQCNT